MALCSVFLEMQKPNKEDEEVREKDHKVQLVDFMENHGDKCIYDLGEEQL